MILSTVLKTLLLPPAINILAILVGVLLLRSHKWLARLCMSVGFLSLWALSLPVVSTYLHEDLEAAFITTTPEQSSPLVAPVPPEGVGAIVVLGAGRHYQAQEYGGGDTLSHHALWRLRYGAVLAKRWGLPVIVSGGNVRTEDVIPEAAMGVEFLQKELGVTQAWEEGRSRNTWENAQFTAALLQEKGIEKVVLVTHAYHMRRSSFSFQQAGITHIPMATGFVSHQSPAAWWRNGLPSAQALLYSYLALHEYLGQWYYSFK